MTDAITLRGIRKTFGSKVAVTNMDLAIKSGSVVAFLGPNGAGKTTTIRMIMSILFPDRGELTVLGRPSAVESKDRIGYLPEERGLYKKMKVASFLGYMARLKGVPEREISQSVQAWLARVDLADVAKKRCEELSKGMQQKVGFIAAVIHNPELLILDEPFSGLDPVNARLLRTLVDEQHQRGCTIIFSTHVMAHAEALCDHVVMIHRGDKVLDEPMSRIRNRMDSGTIFFEPMLPEGVESDDAAWVASIADRLTRIHGNREVVSPRMGQPAFTLRLGTGVDPQGVVRELAATMPARRIEIKRVRLEDVFIQLVGASADGNDADQDLGASAQLAASSAGSMEGE